MICIKFHQKLEKPKFWTFEVFQVLKKPEKPTFFEAIFQP